MRDTTPATSAGDCRTPCHPSPSRAARRRAGRLVPPVQMGPGHGRRSHAQAGQVVPSPANVRLGSCARPEGAQRGDVRVGYGAAGVEVGVQRGELLGQPAHANPDDEPAVGNHVQRGQHPGVEHGMAIGQHQHAETQPDAAGYGGQIAEGGHRLHDAVAGGERKTPVAPVRISGTQLVGHDDMIAEEHAVVTQRLAALGDPRQVIDVGQWADVGQNNAVLHDQHRLETEAQPPCHCERSVAIPLWTRGDDFRLTLRRTRC